jgi:hypothetical protein
MELRALRSPRQREDSQSDEHRKDGHDTIACPKCGYEIHFASDGVIERQIPTK